MLECLIQEPLAREKGQPLRVIELKHLIWFEWEWERKSFTLKMMNTGVFLVVYLHSLKNPDETNIAFYLD